MRVCNGGTFHAMTLLLHCTVCNVLIFKLMFNLLGLREGLRVYPSIPTAIPREIAEGGNPVMGKWLPAGTRVSVHQTATYRSPANFK